MTLHRFGPQYLAPNLLLFNSHEVDLFGPAKAKVPKKSFSDITQNFCVPGIGSHCCQRYLYPYILVFSEIDERARNARKRVLLRYKHHFQRIKFCKIYFSGYCIMVAYANNIAMIFNIGLIPGPNQLLF